MTQPHDIYYKQSRFYVEVMPATLDGEKVYAEIDQIYPRGIVPIWDWAYCLQMLRKAGYSVKKGKAPVDKSVAKMSDAELLNALEVTQ
jgi:hypothetical protein